MAVLMGGFSHIASLKPLQCIFLSCILVKNNFSKQEFKRLSPCKEQCCDGCICCQAFQKGSNVYVALLILLPPRECASLQHSQQIIIISVMLRYNICPHTHAPNMFEPIITFLFTSLPQNEFLLSNCQLSEFEHSDSSLIIQIQIRLLYSMSSTNFHT